MRRVVLTRIAAAVPLLVGVSLATFILLTLAPGSFIDRFGLDPTISEETLIRLTSRYGLDRPWHEQYLSWLGGMLHGDLGFSLAFQRPVAQLIGESAVYTSALVVSAGALSFLSGIALALLVCTRPGCIYDRLLSSAALVAASVPVLVLAVAALGLAARSGAFPLGGGSDAGLAGLGWPTRIMDFVSHLQLPTLVLGIAMFPAFFLQGRGALLETLPTDFVRGARARGLSATQVLFRHGLRAAWVPVLLYAGSSVGRLLNSAFLVEVVTGWPGMGRLALGALLGRDCFLLLGVLLLAALLMLVGNLLGDVAAAAADPRIRLEER